MQAMDTPPRPASSDFPSEHLLRAVGADMQAGKHAKSRVQKMVRARIHSFECARGCRGHAQEVLESARDLLTPDADASSRLWPVILSSIAPYRSLWDRLRSTLDPADALRAMLWGRVESRLQPATARVVVSRPMKWAAAFALVAFVVRASPLLFLAPPTIADSPVTIFATRGQVAVLAGSLWQPIAGELDIRSPVALQTQRGEATIVLHDDAVIRLAPDTEVAFYDISDRPAQSTQNATVRLVRGQIWVLGLVPKHVRGISVVTSQGRVVVHEGSFSAVEGSDVAVTVWDRSAIVSRRGRQLMLFAGNQAVLQKDGALASLPVESARFQDSWVAGNLSRDASHRRDIAQLQQERRAGAAGILPGSKLYPVKRLAEAVDVLLTFGEEDRAKKLVTQANTRLNEAAALMQTGEQAQVDAALREYKDTLLQAASGSGGNVAVQQLLRKEVVEAGSATVSAALPGDPSYALKQTVDDAIAALPATVSKPDAEGEVLLDELAAVKRQADEGDIAQAKEKLVELSESIASLDTIGAFSLLSPDVREEVKAVAEQVAAAIGPAEGVLQLGRPEKEAVVPRRSRSIVTRPLTPEQIVAKAQAIRGRIFVFGTKKGQYDALEDQMRLIANHPDRGRILRELRSALPGNGLLQRVAREIRAVQQEITVLELQRVTSSGGVTVP